MNSLDFPFPLTSRRIAIGAIVLAALVGALILSAAPRPATAHLAGSRPQPIFNTDAPFLDHGAAAAQPSGEFRKSVHAAGSGHTTSSTSSLPSNIIRTGDIAVRLHSKSVLGAKQRLSEMLASFPGAYVGSVSTYDHNRYVDMSLQVPAADFTPVLTDLENSFGKVLSESTTTQDVGLKVVDLNAQLTNLEAQRLALIKLFAKASSVSDTIRLERVLSSVEGQIEQTQGQIKYLNSRINMSTISVEFQAKNAPIKHHKKHHANVIINAFGTAGNGILGVIAGAIVVVGYALPLTGLGLCLYGLVLLGARVMRRRRVLVPVAA